MLKNIRPLELLILKIFVGNTLKKNYFMFNFLFSAQLANSDNQSLHHSMNNNLGISPQSGGTHGSMTSQYDDPYYHQTSLHHGNGHGNHYNHHPSNGGDPGNFYLHGTMGGMHSVSYIRNQG